MDSSPDSNENFILSCFSPVSETNLKFLDTGSIVQLSRKSGKFIHSSDILITSCVTVQRLPLSPIALAPAAILRLIHIPDPSDIDRLLPIPTASPTIALARKS